MESGYYPPGAEYDPDAPWNQTDPEPIEIDASVSTSLSKSIKLEVTDYINNGPDEDGCSDIDFRDCNLKQAFNETYRSIKEILDSFIKVVDNINQNGLTDQNLKLLNILARSSEGWEEDELEVVRD